MIYSFASAHLTFLLVLVVGTAPVTDGWVLFASVKFKPTFIKEYDEKFLVPEFDSKIKERQGELVTLKGHFIPFDFKDNTLILSKYPYSSCFFCGGAGPESVAEIVLSVKPPRLKADQIITVRGKLKLNNHDVNHMNFILTEAEIITTNR